MKQESAKRALESEVEVPVQESVCLAPHTSFGIGGPAALWMEISSAEQLSRALSTAARLGTAPLVLGRGTNLLVSDDGYDGLVLKLCLGRLDVDPDRQILCAGAAALTAVAVEAVLAAGLSGLAFAAGLPGTVGGAIAGNAGCFGHCLSDRLSSATVVTGAGAIVQIGDKKWFDFEYRHSRLLRGGAVLADLTFQLERGDPRSEQEEATRCKAYRAAHHPPQEVKTAGSYFKNLPPERAGGMRQAAGKLLDLVSAKELEVGDAAVFERHANIVINRNNARARDVLELTAQMARRVKDRFGIDLEPEVRFIGPRPELC